MANKPISNTACYCLKIRRTAGNVIHFYDSVLAPSGVTVRQYSLLYAIASGMPCTVAELAARTELDRSTLARSLKPLLKSKLVVDTKESGTRNSSLELTQEGMEVKEQAAGLWADAQKAFEKRLTQEQLSALEDVLAALQTL
ncbi:MAG: winged helix-turn-helix transcriptional regulator [Selenomonadaceae bacterium]|nr:winged helix-turn-helix transcriptional regulator [Selenomonadaceae bacterium]